MLKDIHITFDEPGVVSDCLVQREYQQIMRPGRRRNAILTDRRRNEVFNFMSFC